MVANFSSCIDSFPFQPFLDLHARVSESRVYNFQGLRLPVPSSPRLPVWRSYLRDYEDYAVCDFLEMVGPLDSIIPLLFQRHLIFVITRVPLIFRTPLTVTCYQRL